MAGANAGEIKARLTLQSEDFKRGMEQARSEMEQASKSSQNFKKSLDMIEKGALAVGGAALAGIGSSVKVAADFEQAMARVAAVSGATGDDFKRLEDLARDMGQTTVFSASESASALEFLAMSGMDAEQMIAALPNVLNLAASAQIDLARAADYVTNIMSGFGLTAEDTALAVDVLTKTATTSNSTVPELAEAFKMAGPIAKELGFSIEETAGALGVLHDNGIKGSAAGTTLRAALLSLANPTGQTAKALKDLGINVETADGAMKPLPELIGHIADKTSHLDDVQRTQAVAQLVGTEAASGFLALLAKGEDDLASYTSALEDSAGTAEDVARIQSDTVNGAFKEFQSALEGVGISIGREFLPVVRTMVERATDLTRMFGDLDPAVVALGLKFAAASSGIALAGTTIVKLGIAIRGLFAAMGPAGWLILGLSVLGGLAVATADQTSKLKEVNLDTAKAMTETGDSIRANLDDYEELRRRSGLTNEEFARFVDIQSELRRAVDESKIDELTKEQDELREKSGLSNDELDRMVDLNGDLLEAVPEAERVITDQGNAIIETTDAMRDYVDQLSDATLRELERQKLIAEGNEREIKEELIKLQKEYEEGWEREKELRQQFHDFDEVAHEKRLEEVNLQLQSEEAQGRKNYALEAEKYHLEGLLKSYREDLIMQIEKNDELLEAIELKEAELGLADEITNMMVDQILKQEGINAEIGEGVEAIDKEITKHKEALKELEQQGKKKDANNQLYQEAIQELKDEIAALERVKSTINEVTGAQEETTSEIGESLSVAEELHESLSEGNYSKFVDVSDDGTIADIDRRASNPVTKTINLREVMQRAAKPAYHQGGLVGKRSGTLGELPKLHTGGLVSQFADRPMFNEIDVRLLRNEMVLTEAQQANLFRMLDTAPVQQDVPDKSSETLLRRNNKLLEEVISALEHGREIKMYMNHREVGRIMDQYLGEKRDERLRR